MKYTYGVCICTFNGADRVRYLLESLKDAPSLRKFDKHYIIEDLVPPSTPETYKVRKTSGPENHRLLADVAKEYGWDLVSLEKWGNMQGCANKAFETCETDFVWYLSDDLLCAGDPFRFLLNWAENADKEIIDFTGAISPNIYNSCSEMKHLFKEKDHRDVQIEFYTDPFNTWFKDRTPIQFDTHLTLVPSVTATVNGATFIVKRDAWRQIGGINPDWDVLDQEFSYSIYLNTNRILYNLPTDPFYHAGGCAQNSGFLDLRKQSGWHRQEDRCVEIFGKKLTEVDQDVHRIAGSRAEQWQDKLVSEWMRINKEKQVFQWKWV